MKKSKAPKYPNRLADVLKDRGMTIVELKRLTGLGEGTVYDLKNGKQQFSMDSLKTVADAIGVAQGDLLIDGGAGRLVQTVPFDALDLNPDNPRRDFDPFSLETLATSITFSGVIVPLLVEPEENGRYRIISGERRYRAMESLIRSGQEPDNFPMPVAIKELADPDRPDRDRLITAITENVAREDMSAADEGSAYHKLIDDFGLTSEVVANIIGRTARHVQSRIKIVRDLSENALGALKEGAVTTAQAEALASAAGDLQDKVLNLIRSGMSGLDTEAGVRAHIKREQRQEAHDADDRTQFDIEDAARETSVPAALQVNGNNVIIDGFETLDYSSDSVDALIHVAEATPDRWVGAYDIKFKCGSWAGESSPLSINSLASPNREAAVFHAAEHVILFAEGIIASNDTSSVTKGQRLAAEAAAGWAAYKRGEENYIPPERGVRADPQVRSHPTEPGGASEVQPPLSEPDFLSAPNLRFIDIDTGDGLPNEIILYDIDSATEGRFVRATD